MDTTQFLVDFILDNQNESDRIEKLGFMCDINANFGAIKNILLKDFYKDLGLFLRPYFPEDIYSIAYSSNASVQYSQLCIWKKDWENQPSAPDIILTQENTTAGKGLVNYCLESGKSSLNNFYIGIITLNRNIILNNFKDTTSITIPDERKDATLWLKYKYLEKYDNSWRKDYLLRYMTTTGKHEIFEYYRDQFLTLKKTFETALDNDVARYTSLV